MQIIEKGLVRRLAEGEPPPRGTVFSLYEAAMTAINGCLSQEHFFFANKRERVGILKRSISRAVFHAVYSQARSMCRYDGMPREEVVDVTKTLTFHVTREIKEM